MDEPIWLIVYGIIILVAIIITIVTVQGQKDEIRQALEKKEAKNIIISWMPLDFDKSNHTYSVEYEDSSGKKHNTSCKVHIWGSSIYWEDENK